MEQFFFVDGDSLLLNLMGNAYYDPDNGGQFSHLTFLCERQLQLFARKGGKFEIIFCNIWNRAWSSKPTLLLARSALISHLRFNMLCKVHEFDSMWDVNLRTVLEKYNCAFILTDFQMLDSYFKLFPHDDHTLQKMIFHVSICYSLLSLYLGCVDMSEVELTVSTLNGFYCPPVSKLQPIIFRQLLKNSITRIEENCRPSPVSTNTVASLLRAMEGEMDVRHVVTVIAAAQFLEDCDAPQPCEDWIRAFLIYSSVLEVLPLSFRGCCSFLVHTTTFTEFLKKLHKYMNCVLQTILHDIPNVNYSFNTVADLWHGNLFVLVLKYVTAHSSCEEILLGDQVLTAYDHLLLEVMIRTEKALTRFPVRIQNIVFSAKASEGEENTSAESPACSLPLPHNHCELVPTGSLLAFKFCEDVVPDAMRYNCDNRFLVNIPRNISEPQKHDILKKELEEEDKVLDMLNEMRNMKENETLETLLADLERVTDEILKFSFQDITSMFSNGAVFFVDGDSLLLNLMGNANYDPENGGQFLHLTYLCERQLQLFARKGGKFEIIFCNIWNRAWSSKPTLLLARSALISHLRFNMLCKVHEFDSMWDVNLRTVLEKYNCAFILTDFQMLDSYFKLFPHDDHTLQKMIFHVSICYSLLSLYLGCVDMSEVELTVSTLNGFYCPPVSKLQPIIFRQLLKNSITRIEENCRPSPVSTNTVASLLRAMEGEMDVRHVVTVIAAAQFLEDCDAPQPCEDWIRAFLIYSSVLEVLPLSFRGCCSFLVHTTTFTEFLKKLHKYMNCVLQTILHDIPNVNYSFNTVADLWHGNLFVLVLKYVTAHSSCEEILLGDQVLTAYDHLLLEVMIRTEKALTRFPVRIQNIVFSAKASEGEENTSAESPACSLPSPHNHRELPTGCLLAFQFCEDILPDAMRYNCNNRFLVNISRNSNFKEKIHWYCRKPLTDEYDHVKVTDNRTKPLDKYELKKEDRNKGKYAHFMSIYGSSIEGRSSSTKSIVCEAENLSKKGAKTKKPGKKAQEIREENDRRKQAKIEESDKEMLDNFKEAYKRCKQRGDYHAALNEVKLLEGKVKTNHILQNALLYKVRILWFLWQRECRRIYIVSDRNLHYAKELFIVIRRILKDFEGTTCSDADAQFLGCCLRQMGLGKIAQGWNLPLPSKSTTDQLYSIRMSWIDFQLLHLGPELEREMESRPDKRVEGFMPDKWQVELFDCVDEHQSVLVVAPTSSGKTYASYYCMEKVLRESNDGVVVYVAPTKALVNQVAATIYARFKNKDMPAGKSVYGVFTRDYRSNALNSQILVTVPECLALLLLSPRRHGWVRSLRYVIFDEIHCLAGQLGGFSLECGLLLIRCPFLALSATVEDPEALHTWLESMQCFKKMQDTTSGCKKPDNFYEVKLVVHKDRHADLTKHVYCEDGQFHHIHPYTYLDRSVIEMGKGIPQHITLSPEEVHNLYIAMNVACPRDPRLSKLQPELFFSKCTDGFISRNMVRDFEVELRKLLAIWVTEDNATFESVVMQLRTVENTVGSRSEARFIMENFIPFVQKLQEQNMLPAIVFSYNRLLVEWFLEHTTEYYEDVALKCEEEKVESRLVDKKKSRKDEVMQERTKKDKTAVCFGVDDFCVSRGVPGRNKYEASLNLLHSGSTNSSLIRGGCHGDENLIKYIERRLMIIGYKKEDLFPRGLSMGVGMHHGGLNDKERSAVEMLFQMKVLNLVFATGTLALGIHMPCKTVAIVGDSPYLNPLEFQQMSGRAGRRGFDTAGNVVFMGVNERKTRMLLTGKLPNIVGNFPLNVTMVVRLLLMVSDVTSYGAHSEEVTRDALSRALTLLNCCLVYQTLPELKIQMKHFFAFSIQLLMLQGLLDDEGNPQYLAGIITHLHYHEPGNLAFVYLLRSGALRQLCTPEKDGTISKATQMNLVLVLSYLFAPLVLHERARNIKYNNSKVVLPPLPPEIKKVLEMYNEEVMCIYDLYFKCVAEGIANNLGEDVTLPMSGVRIMPREAFVASTEGPMSLERHLVEGCEPKVICSAFAALSGHSDRGLYSHYNMISSIRHQVFTDVKVVPIVELNKTYNGYAWDFYNHGIVAAIMNDNGLKQGADFNLLKDFSLVLKVIKISLSELEPVDENDQVLRTFDVVEENFSAKFRKAYGIVNH